MQDNKSDRVNDSDSSFCSDDFDHDPSVLSYECLNDCLKRMLFSCGK